MNKEALYTAMWLSAWGYYVLDKAPSLYVPVSDGKTLTARDKKGKLRCQFAIDYHRLRDLSEGISQKKE